MAARVESLPDVLVLGAGGTLGIAWLRGLLAGIESEAALDFRRCEYFVGTSAGSYVGALLAAGEPPDSDAPTPRSPDSAALPDGDSRTEPGRLARIAAGGGRLAAAATAPVMPLALRATRAGGAVARAAVLAAAPRPDRGPSAVQRAVARLDTSFDGRLRVVAVDRTRGRRVVFGAPGAPRAEVADAVAASCAVPWLFSPVEIDGRDYFDGGVWSLSNLDVAPAGRGAEVLALLPTLSQRTGRGTTALLRAAAQATALAELQVLRTRGARVRLVGPDRAATDAIGPQLMNVRRVGPVYEAGFTQGRRLARA